MIAVVDASVVADALIRDQHTMLLDRLSMFEMAATVAHFDAEVGSALRGVWLGRQMSRDSFRDVALQIPELPIIRYPIDSLLGRIVDLADNASFYDAAYIALAEALDADVLTADKRLASVPGVLCNVIVV